MDILKIYQMLDRDIRLNYNGRAEFGRKVGKSRQEIFQLMQILKKNSKRNPANRIFNILEKAGYKIEIKKG